MGRCRFPSNRSNLGVARDGVEGCLLAATRSRHPTHQLGQTGRSIESINLALQGQGKVLHVKTDSVCLYHWISDTLTRKARVRTKAASEMLIRRPLSTLKELVKEYMSARPALKFKPRRGNAFRASHQVSENSELFKKLDPGAQFQWERISSKRVQNGTHL